MSSTHPYLLPVFFVLAFKKHPVYFINVTGADISFNPFWGQVFILLERLKRLLPRKITTFFADTIFMSCIKTLRISVIKMNR
jgi:hypothetical protein